MRCSPWVVEETVGILGEFVVVARLVEVE